jgi:hypothetical protein
MTSATFEECLVQLDHQVGAKNRKFLFFIGQWAAYPRDATALKNITVIFLTPNCTSYVQPVDRGVIHAFKMPVQEATHMAGSSNDRHRITW